MTKVNSSVAQVAAPAPEKGTDGPASPSNVSTLPTKAPPTDFLAARQEAKEQAVAAKLVTEQQARQWLAQAHELDLMGGEKAKESKEIADKASLALYQVRASGAMSVDQLNALLGDIYGYKPKKDKGDAPIMGAGHPDASKTPFGQGEAIRKRVVRTVALKEFIESEGVEGGTFFEGLSPDSEDAAGNSFADVLSSVDSGNLTIWTAYDKLAKIKGNARQSVAPAFNARAIVAITETLAANTARSAELLIDDEELADAYAALRSMLLIVGQEAGRLVGEREAA